MNITILSTLLTLCVLLNGCTKKPVPMTAAGNPAEGNIESFLGEPRFDIQNLSERAAWPNLVVAVDGTVLPFWIGRNEPPRFRRSEDGGATWEEERHTEDPPGRGGRRSGTSVVDETTGDIIVFGSAESGLWNGHSWRSHDNGKTWSYNGASEDIVKPHASIAIEGTPSKSGRGLTHGSEGGITLRHGENKGRLLVPARSYGSPGQRADYTELYNCAIYSDDGGRTWQTSAPFPAFGTGEGTLAELSDGRIYYNSRRHWAPEEEGENVRMRWIAWSHDGGETWKDLSVSKVLPDGEKIRDYGCKGGLVRLPVEKHDILIFSMPDSPVGRINGTVWASFDGGNTWPVKRVVEEGGFGYSSLAAGRPGTPSEGMIYLHFSKIARFNLSWLLEGELTGDGTLPGWVERRSSIDAKADINNREGLTSPVISHGDGVEDTDGNTYKTVKIGSQEWMAENLDVSTFKNGDPIPEAKTADEWLKAVEEGKPAWCFYANDPANGKRYGKLYNWHAVTDPRGLAPAGWHLPTNAEWTQLKVFLGGEDVAGSKMKSTGGWKENGNGTNESGFSGLPAGTRGDYPLYSFSSVQRRGTFSNLGSFGCWWEYDTTNARFHYMHYGDGSAGSARNTRRESDNAFWAYQSYGFSVRSLRD